MGGERVLSTFSLQITILLSLFWIGVGRKGFIEALQCWNREDTLLLFEVRDSWVGGEKSKRRCLERK